VHPDDRAAVETAYSDAVAQHRPYEISHRVLTRDGRVKHVQERGQTVYSTDGRPVRTIGTVQDVTEQFYANEQVRLAASMFEASADGILVADASNRIMTVNRALERMMGYSADELIGQTPRMLRSGRHDAGFYSEMWATLTSTGRWSGEVWDRRKSGEEFPVHLTITAVRDARGVTTHYGAVMRDITAQRRTEERIFQLAFHDQLTGLPNRGLFRDRLDHALVQARRTQRSLAVLFLDLDRFKNVNDSFGHDVGDALLVEFARRIRHAIRASDTVSRQGGDEFVVLLPGIEHEIDAARAAEAVIHAVSAPFEANGREITITSSIGVAVYPSNGTDADTLLRNADAAMYAAKAAGRNCYRFFTEDLNRRALERLSLENDLRRAIERHELVLYFQPQIDLTDGHMIGAEALVRWSHPTLGLLGPDRFIPIAEETRLIVDIDAWVMRESCVTMQRWRNAAVPVHTLAVNASAEQLRHNAFRDLIATCLHDHAIDPRDIELEFTETILIEDQDVVLARLADIRSLGVSIAIDDFGTGYSSLSYLPRFAARRIKLASSFVRGIEKNPQTLAVAASMIDLAHRLGMKVVAEGVESAGELRVLKDLGCDAAQGFYLARPMPEDDLVEFARTTR
jgi:diguanylate cyclase (GGDEF)-like protein/PAS domain S-box-containing protein